MRRAKMEQRISPNTHTEAKDTFVHVDVGYEMNVGGQVMAELPIAEYNLLYHATLMLTEAIAID